MERYSVGKVLFQIPVVADSGKMIAAAGVPLSAVGLRICFCCGREEKFLFGVKSGQILVNGSANQLGLWRAGAFDVVRQACELAFFQVQGDSSQQWYFPYYSTSLYA